MNNQIDKIVIPCCHTYEFLEFEQIIRFEGLQNYTRVFIKDGRSIVSTTNIGYYKTNLTDQGFFCCHKSHLVNEQHIVRYHKEGTIELTDFSMVPVSRRKKQIFIDRVLEKYSITERKEAKLLSASLSMQPLQIASQ